MLTVKGVDAHMLVVPTMAKGKVFMAFASSGFNLDQMSAELVDRLSADLSGAETMRGRQPSFVSTTLENIRRLASAYPEVTERASHGAPCFFVARATALCYFHHDHRGDGRTSLWCPSPAGVPEEMVSAEPERFFRPPTSAGGAFGGWLGVYLDADADDHVDWAEIGAILDDAYRTAAPTRLVTKHFGGNGQPDEPLRSADGSFRFRSELWLHQGEAAWFFLTIPVEVAAEIDIANAREPRGFGSIRVNVTVGATTWATSIFPDSKRGTYILPVKKAVRKAEGLTDRDEIDVMLKLE